MTTRHQNKEDKGRVFYRGSGQEHRELLADNTRPESIHVAQRSLLVILV